MNLFIVVSTFVTICLIVFIISGMAFKYGMLISQLSITGYLAYCGYIYFSKSRTLLHYKATERNQEIISECPNLKTFKENFFIPTAFLQTLLSSFTFGEASRVVMFSKRIITEGETSTLDWVFLASSESPELMLAFQEGNKKEFLKAETFKKLLVIIPGLTGSVKDNYVRLLAYEGLKNKYRVVIFNDRLLSKDIDFSSKEEYVNIVEDLSKTFDYLAKEYPNYTIYSIGNSYGANKLVNYLGTRGDKSKVKGAVSIANPFDMHLNSRYIHSGFYDFLLARILVRALKQRIDKINMGFYKIEQKPTMRSLTCRDFDEYFTKHVYNYPTVDSYYRDMSCVHRILNVKIPLLCLQAADDPIVHKDTIPDQECEANENIILAVTEKGGHIGWIQGLLLPKPWFQIPAIEYLNSISKK